MCSLQPPQGSARINTDPQQIIRALVTFCEGNLLGGFLGDPKLIELGIEVAPRHIRDEVADCASSMGRLPITISSIAPKKTRWRGIRLRSLRIYRMCSASGIHEWSSPPHGGVLEAIRSRYWQGASKRDHLTLAGYPAPARGTLRSDDKGHKQVIILVGRTLEAYEKMGSKPPDLVFGQSVHLLIASIILMCGQEFAVISR